MLCYIIYPADLSDDELDSPECLSRLKVQVNQFISECVITTSNHSVVKTDDRMFVFSTGNNHQQVGVLQRTG